IHSLVNPIDGYFPDNANTIFPTNDSLWFKGVFVKPSPNTLKTTWDVNSGVIATNKDSVMVPDFFLMQGSNLVTLTVTDTTKLSQDTSHANDHIYSVSWVVNYSTVGIKEVKSKLELSLFPNPANEVLNIKYNLKEESGIGISIIDMNGKVIVREKPYRAKPGAYENSIDVRSLVPGNYIVSIKLDQHTINQNIIIVK
ncbi:MAG: T9SS type A sorting domain-containing protein, partial [Bacteroidia bacterium]|nr:T9SS type A sorting domain-containing protein [Bacteroidia bacterium]